ncbi:MAG: deoxyribose-phosphate aldolase [Chloroflexi bacterium]|nr:deoxyribose-phosphate aldolase [Chloroflexota bacterium]
MPHDRNAGTPLNLDAALSKRVNESATRERAAQLPSRRTVSKQVQTAWLLKAVTLIDLTTLSGDDTPAKVNRLCAKALNPIRRDILQALEFDRPLTTGAVCVYPSRVPDAAAALAGTDLPIATVSSGFPAAQGPLQPQLDVVVQNVAEGATEIDMVISREFVFTGNWQALYDEVKAFRSACGEAHLKVILETGELATMQNIYRASMISMMAGGDFIKTSTGKASVNATLEAGLIMCRAIRDYCQMTGYKVGLKPAGGIRSGKDAIAWLVLVKEELGNDWLNPDLYRIGASSLLGAIERDLYQTVSGRAAAPHHFAMS